DKEEKKVALLKLSIGDRVRLRLKRSGTTDSYVAIKREIGTWNQSSSIRERIKFYSIYRNKFEEICNFMDRLDQQAEKCDFDGEKDDHIKDMLNVYKKEKITFKMNPTAVFAEIREYNFIEIKNEVVKEPIKDVEHVAKIQQVKEPEKVLELIKIEFIDRPTFIELKSTFKPHFILPAFFDWYIYIKAGRKRQKYIPH
ncbi:hypothetical protein A3Q56_08652, partial [Intoshia linei]